VYTELTYEVHDDVAVITLNRPEARNALTHTTYAELEEAVRSTTARCLVITGADPAFCSGDDVKQVMLAAGAEVSASLRSEPRLTPAANMTCFTSSPEQKAGSAPVTTRQRAVVRRTASSSSA